MRQWWGRASSIVLLQWPAVTFGVRVPNTNEFLTNSKKIRDGHVHRTRHKHDRRSYLSDGIGGDSQSLLERERLRSKDRGLLSYNIDYCNVLIRYAGSCWIRTHASACVRGRPTCACMWVILLSLDDQPTNM